MPGNNSQGVTISAMIVSGISEPLRIEPVLNWIHGKKYREVTHKGENSIIDPCTIHSFHIISI